jgi:hypothetical protein
MRRDAATGLLPRGYGWSKAPIRNLNDYGGLGASREPGYTHAEWWRAASVSGNASAFKCLAAPTPHGSRFSPHTGRHGCADARDRSSRRSKSVRPPRPPGHPGQEEA